MGRCVRAGLAFASVLIACGVLSTEAGAVTVGRDMDFNNTAECGLAGAFFAGSGVSDYVVPISGVLTSWRLRRVTSADPTFKFKVGRGDPDILTVGETPAAAVGDRIEAAARIPVRAGDRIGLFARNAGVDFKCGGSPLVSDQEGGNDVPPGETATYSDAMFRAYPLSAVVEPDADGDGYGDESQDRCPTDRSTQGPCPVAATPVTPRDTVAPVISRAGLSSTVFAVNSKASASAVRRGSRLRLTLSEPATVVFVTEQRVGRRWRTIRIFGLRLPTGQNSVNYSGRIKPRNRTRALRPGRYRLRMRPSDRAGNKGKVTAVGFRIAP